MGFLIIALMAIFGAALIVGGFVAYRRSEVTSVKAVSAGAVAAGVVMWAIIILVTPLSSSSG
jgi:hypothetical protein